MIKRAVQIRKRIVSSIQITTLEILKTRTKSCLAYREGRQSFPKKENKKYIKTKKKTLNIYWGLILTNLN